jgi:RNAse (barnase) inhibitor barstar
MTEQQPMELLTNLVKQPMKIEWEEFKLNFHSEQEIGDCISVLANKADIVLFRNVVPKTKKSQKG